MFSNQYIVSKDELLKKFITKDFMIMLQAEIIRVFNFKSTYLLGDDLFHFECAGTYNALKKTCSYYNALEIIEFIDKIDWFEYDHFMSELGYVFARRYGLYTPKRRWRNIWKAERCM